MDKPLETQFVNLYGNTRSFVLFKNLTKTSRYWVKMDLTLQLKSSNQEFFIKHYAEVSEIKECREDTKNEYLDRIFG